MEIKLLKHTRNGYLSNTDNMIVSLTYNSPVNFTCIVAIYVYDTIVSQGGWVTLVILGKIKESCPQMG